MEIEQTLFAIKPDALKYSVTGYILTMMSRTNLVYTGSKIVRANDLIAREHYAAHKDKDFFEHLVRYIKGELHYRGSPDRFPFTQEYRRIFLIVYHGQNAVREVRNMVGPTSPIEARQNYPGTIRAMGAIYDIDIEDEPDNTLFENLVHASGTPEEARSEIQLWFEPREIPSPLRIFPVVQSEEYFFLSPDLEVTTKQKPMSKCIISSGDPVWEDDYAALRGAVSGDHDERAVRRAVAKFTL